MELEKGVCFSCDDKKLILNQCSETIQQIFVHLYTETVLNVQKLQSITPSLKLCPICYHKLILLEQIYEHIQANRSLDEDKSCILCKKGDSLFKISKWNYFKDISDDFPVFSNKNKYDVCSQCCFYLDSRHFLKKRLFSKYPQLRSVPKLKLKFGTEITSHSTPRAAKRRYRSSDSKKSSEVLYISSDSEISSEPPKGFDLSFIKSLEVLRNNSVLRGSEIIDSDPKLLNQILYVKIKRNNFRSDQKKDTSEDISDKNDVVTLPKTPLKKTSIKIKKPFNEASKTFTKRNESKSDRKESELLENSPESVNLLKKDTSHETSEDSSITKKTYFKIKFKKQSSKTNKLSKKDHHVNRKNNETFDNFTKSLVINLEKKTLLPTATDDSNMNFEKIKENGEDMSIEVMESEEKSQTETESSRMEVDETDNSKHDYSSEEQISLRMAEDKDSNTADDEKDQLENNDEGGHQSIERKSIPDEVEKMESEVETEKHHENNDEQEKSESEDPETQCGESIPEVKKQSHCEDGNLISEEEKYFKEDDSNRKSPVEEPTSGKPVVSDEEEDISKKNDQSQVPANAEESCNGESAENTVETCSKSEPEISSKTTDDKEASSDKDEIDDKESPSDKDETGDKESPSDKDETGDKKESDNEEKEDIVDKNEKEDIVDKNESGENDKEIGIDEEDRNNIDTMLSELATGPPELNQEKFENAEEEATKNNTEDASVDDISTGCKRKRTDSPDVSSSPEKKKKKVTFADSLDSSE